MEDLGEINIWRAIRLETGSVAINEMFLERSPVADVLMNNGIALRLAVIKEILDRAAYERKGGVSCGEAPQNDSGHKEKGVTTRSLR